MEYTTLLLVLLSAHATIQTCTIDEIELFSKYDHEPLILDAKTLDFVYPLDKNNPKIITVAENDEILISCGANTLGSHSDISIDNRTIRAKCNSNSSFIVNGTVLKVEEVLCISDLLEDASSGSPTLKKCANNKGILIDVGYNVEAVNHRVPLYEVCFDLSAKTVFYTKFVSPELANTGNNFSSRSFFPTVDALFYYGIPDLELSDIFNSRANAKTKINQLVGLPANSDKYFPSHFDGENSVSISIDKDRLADYVFFYYRTQQHSTSRYINVIPIWNVYRYSNLNNWDSIRFGLRRFTLANRYELEIYTGTYGVATLPHEDSSKGDIELYLSRDNTTTFPLAKLLWRLVYNKATKSAIVLVSVNNPWVVKDNDKICEDVSSQSRWDRFLTWDRTRSDLMYSYACRYEDFKKVVTFVPELTVEGVLNSSHKQGISLLIIALSAALWKFL